MTLAGRASPADRDRDGSGRPRNARPRDGLGRPLPRGAAGEPVAPDDLRLTAGETLRYAQELIDQGRPFHAHEVLEAAWKAAPADQRDVWQGLAQVAVGLTHARRGNGPGAVALLRRGADRVGTGQRAWIPPGLDADGVRRSALDLAAKIAHDGTGALTESDLRLRLLPVPGG
jgi:uncharacterized protein